MNKLNRLDKAVKFYEECVRLCDELGEIPEKMRALTDLAEVYHRQGNYELAVHTCAQSIQIGEEFCRESDELAYSLNILGLLYRFLGRWQEAIECHKRSIAIYRARQNDWGVGTALHNLGHIFKLQRRSQDAARCFEEAKTIFERLDDEYWKANCEYSLGGVDNDRSEWLSARARLENALAVKERLEDVYGASKILSWLGYTYWHLGEGLRSTDCYQRAITIARERKNAEKLCEYLTEFCLLRYYEAQDSLETLTPFINEAEQLARQHGFWDHCARLLVLQGDEIFRDKKEQWFDDVVAKYLEAMRCALRFNRYVLDEVLARIIAKCAQEGIEGQRVLDNIRKYWQEETPQGESLLRMEEEARKRERGDGLPQVSVVEQIASALDFSAPCDLRPVTCKPGTAP